MWLHYETYTHPPRRTPTRSYCLLGPACLTWPVAAHLLEQLNKLLAARQDQPDIFIVVADVVVVVVLNEYLMPQLVVAFSVSIKQWQVQCQTRLKKRKYHVLATATRRKRNIFRLFLAFIYVYAIIFAFSRFSLCRVNNRETNTKRYLCSL